MDISAGIAFLGAQGDVWDAQKDMALAGIGALLAMLIILCINFIFNRSFAKEFKQSFYIPTNDAPLGEEKLKQWLKK